MNIYRHGDVGITPINKLPSELAQKYKGNSFVLAYGEQTGHKHLLTMSPHAFVEVLENSQNQSFLKIWGGVGTLTHEEHKTITIQPGIYKINTEREYDYFMEEIKRVTD